MYFPTMIKNLAFSLLVIAVASCSHKTSTSTSNNPDKLTGEESVALIDFEKRGYVKASVVDRSALDGCGFMLKLAASGKFLEPDKLDDAFHIDGALVWIKYSIRKGGASICMSGTMINLNAIEKGQ